MAEFIEDPTRPGYFIGVIGPSMYEDLRRPVTAEEWKKWDLEAEWDTMIYGNSLWNPLYR